MLDKETAQDLSKALKIDLFTIYREHLQLLFLKHFYRHKDTERVFFKDGTAIRLLFDSFRFSEDLDFTSLLNKTKLEKLINQTLTDLEKEAGTLSFKKEETLVKQAFKARIFQELEHFDFPLTVRLDFSLREKPLYTDVSMIETVFPVGPYPRVAHLRVKEIMTEKIRAIFTRTRGRDIFDLYFLLSKKHPIDWNLVNKKMALYKKKANLAQLIERIEKFSEEEIKQDLTKFLPLTHRDLAGKTKSLVLEKLRNI
jgi:predicted nucleotidyltransferase component of viral defense system